MRSQVEYWCTPSQDCQPKHRVKEGGTQRRGSGRLVHQGLKGASIKIIEYQAVTVMINKWSEFDGHSRHCFWCCSFLRAHFALLSGTSRYSELPRSAAN